MKPGPRGLNAIKEALIAAVPRDKLATWHAATNEGDPRFDLEDWVMTQLQEGDWISFNPEKAKDINYMYKLRREILDYFS